MEIMSSEKCKLIDKLTINEIGIPSIVLMENAAISIYKEIYNMGDSFLVICGQGNNGGDGLAIARHLFNNGKKVKVYIVTVNENYSEDFKLNLKILTNIENIEIKKIKSREIKVIDVINKINSRIYGFDVWINKEENIICKSYLLWLLDDKEELLQLKENVSKFKDSKVHENSENKYLEMHDYISYGRGYFQDRKSVV